MFKIVKGFVNTDKKGKNFKVVTSVYNGEDSDKEIQEKVINSLESFGFKSQKGKSDTWMNFSVEITGNNEAELEKLKEIAKSKKRVTITVVDKEDEVSVTDIIDTDDEIVSVMEREEEEKTFYGYLNLSDYGSIRLNTSVKIVDNEDAENIIAYYEQIGFKEGESKNDEFKNFNMWINKPSEAEKEMIGETGRYKYTINIATYRNDASRILGITSVEEIEESVSKEEKEEIEEEADF